MTHVFQTLDLALNEPIQQGMSPTIAIGGQTIIAIDEPVLS
jgi:hypothetical protein